MDTCPKCNIDEIRSRTAALDVTLHHTNPDEVSVHPDVINAVESKLNNLLKMVPWDFCEACHHVEVGSIIH